MTFDDWCATCGAYLNDNDDAARAARLMARRAWDASAAEERNRCKTRAIQIMEYHRNEYIRQQIDPIVTELRNGL
jgi:hypothetical protein